MLSRQVLNQAITLKINRHPAIVSPKVVEHIFSLQQVKLFIFREKYISNKLVFKDITSSPGIPLEYKFHEHKDFSAVFSEFELSINTNCVNE